MKKMNASPHVIDLTESAVTVTVSCHTSLNNIVIEIDDCLSDVPVTPRRRQRSRVNVPGELNTESPVVVVDSPIIPINEPVRRRKSVKKGKTKVVARKSETSADYRERSPLGPLGDCAICLERFHSQPLLCTKCGHVFCQDCLIQALNREKKCPTCRKALRGKTAYHPIFLSRQ